MKAPHFFVYAKKKDDSRVQKANSSVVNNLDDIIPNKRMVFSAKNLGAFRYRYMLSDPGRNITVEPQIVKLYDDVEKQYRYSISFYDDDTNYGYVRDSILHKFGELDHSLNDVCDMLVKYLFHTKQSKRKNVFWMCFGDMVYENLHRNIPSGSIQCRKCGERFMPVTPQQRVCSKCSTYKPVARRVIRCIDCGIEFEVSSSVKNKKRCDSCQSERMKQYEREKKRKQRSAA